MAQNYNELRDKPTGGSGDMTKAVYDSNNDGVIEPAQLNLSGYLTSVATAWPIGSVFLSVVSTNPATLLGFGTWSQIAQGQMLVGFKTGDADFGTVEATGGAKTLNASHTNNHTGGAVVSGTTGISLNAHTSASTKDASSGSATTKLTGPASHIITDGGHGHTFTQPTAHGNHTDSILNPFFVIYVWKRTA